MGRTYIYTRASTDKQGRSPRDQAVRCVEYHAIMGTLPPLMKEAYQDAATSGSSPFAERRAGRELLLQLQPLDHLIVDAWDRIGRDIIDSIATVRLLHKRRIIVHILNLLILNKLELDDPMAERLMIQFAEAAQSEKKMVSARNKRTHIALKMQGRKPCGGRITGYNSVPNPAYDKERAFRERGKYKESPNLLVPYPEDKDYFDRAFDLFVAGEKITRIQRSLANHKAAKDWPYDRLYRQLWKEQQRRQDEEMRQERLRTFESNRAYGGQG